MDSAQTDAYLDRLGAERPARPTADALRTLHLRHLETVPFENLSIHLGEEIVLTEERLLGKVLGTRRGGFCYELNGAFAALLTTLGFEVTLLAARVHTPGGGLGIPFDHLALLVRTVDGGEWLADIGFGGLSNGPLAWRERGDQVDDAGVFRLVDVAGTGGDVDVVKDGTPQYRLETRPRALGDFVAGAWWHRTSPESHFTRSLVCSRLTEDGGRVTLSGRKVKVTGVDGAVSEVRELGDDAEVLAAYRDRFGIELARVPQVRGTENGGRE
ncbi:arylamine N-acetyltransferase [Streptomyces sp. NPDC006997]|uniref:arylamine N-acetyltransferase family protein n=1 Tax=Streptomyces sp. NPDC006997 TaxID=3155356 RepID=UPI0033E0E863